MRELSDPLTEEDKVWLRSWNRGNEIPGEEGGGVQTVLIPGAPPGGETNPANPNAPVSQGSEGGDDPFDGEEPPEDYNDWTSKQLAWELGNRELPKSGNKPDLVARLEEDDANREEDDDDEDDTP
jgi:hypothetical protein